MHVSCSHYMFWQISMQLLGSKSRGIQSVFCTVRILNRCHQDALSRMKSNTISCINTLCWIDNSLSSVTKVYLKWDFFPYWILCKSPFFKDDERR